jgi:hypothetical protein
LLQFWKKIKYIYTYLGSKGKVIQWGREGEFQKNEWLREEDYI